jgi:hypothetical protein
MISLMLCLGFISGVSLSSVLVLLHAMFNDIGVEHKIY